MAQRKPPKGPIDDVFIGGPRSGQLGRVDDRILAALARIDDGAPADRAVRAVFRNARDLGSHDRQLVGDTVFAICRSRRRLDDRIRRAMKSLKKKPELYDSPILRRMVLLAYRAEQGWDQEQLLARDTYAFKRIPRLFDRIVRGKGALPSNLPAVTRIGIQRSLPDRVVRPLVEAFGEVRAEEIAAALELRAPLTVRVNPACGDRAEIAEQIRATYGVEVALCTHAPHGLRIEGRVDLERWPLFAQGALEIQDEGSQLAALALGAQPGDKVVDACAGAGGKTLALAAQMQGQGRIAAVDIEQKKLDALVVRARRAKLTNLEVTQADLRAAPDRLVGWADRVLLDAPCTGSGVYRRQPDARWRIDDAMIQRFSALQAGLLLRSADLLRPGGILAYVTCSVLPAENEAVVARVLAEDRRLAPVPLATTWGDALAEAFEATDQVRIGPGPTAQGPDGFFVALLSREA